MEKRDLPRLAGSLKLLLDPLSLLRVGRPGVEREKADVRLRAERVVKLSLHVEQLVVPLFTRIFVAKRGMELDTRVQQRLVRGLEFLQKIPRPFRSVEIAADQKDEVIFEASVQTGHLLGELVLRSFPCAGVSKNGEFQGFWPVRQSNQGVGNRLLRKRHRDEGKDDEEQKFAHGDLTVAAACRRLRRAVFPRLRARRPSRGCRP